MEWTLTDSWEDEIHMYIPDEMRAPGGEKKVLYIEARKDMALTEDDIDDLIEILQEAKEVLSRGRDTDE